MQDSNNIFNAIAVKEQLESINSVQELLKSGIVLCTDYGFIGYEAVCRTIKSEREGKDSQLVFAKYADNEDSDNLFMSLCFSKKNDTDNNGRALLYGGRPFSISSCNYAVLQPNALVNYFYYNNIENILGMAINVCRTQKFDFLIPICSISDRIAVTAYSESEFKDKFFELVSSLNTNYCINVLYNGLYSQPSQIVNFIKNIEKGVKYCSIVITDITESDDCVERFYAIEYINGSFRIFTMINGFDGDFDTQDYSGYLIVDDSIVFDNGIKKYSFPLCGDMCLSNSNSEISDDEFKIVLRTVDVLNDRTGLGETMVNPIILQADKCCYNEFIKDIEKCFEINEKYSNDDYYAIMAYDIKESVLDYEECIVPADPFYDGLYHYYKIPVVSFRTLPPPRKGKYGVGEDIVLSNIPSVLLPINETEDGGKYIMLSKSLWNCINLSKYSYALFKDGIVNLYIKGFYDFDRCCGEFFEEHNQYRYK